MKLTCFSILLLSSLLCFNCSQPAEKKNIVVPTDYEVYLHRDSDEAMKKIETDMLFWKQKLDGVPKADTYRASLAALYSARFAINGKIEDIVTSDSLYYAIQNDTRIDYSYIHRALAANCITQHKFLEAYDHIQRALAIGDGKAASLFMLVDVDVELGNLDGARNALKKITNHNFFPWLIREAKIQDHEGRLDSAIFYMEKALTKVESNPSTSLWTLSNLADMYGHAGRIEEAYKAYLKVLTIDPDYDYALKGIAWIAYSNDHNFAEAKKLATYLSAKRATPDMHLFLSQIANAENNAVEKKKQLDLFVKTANVPKYGDMYNKYLALLYAEELASPAQTVALAQREIHNRPTAQSFDLLAWGYFKEGNFQEAFRIAQEHVEGNTWEPDAYYHLAMIYQANGKTDEAREYFEKAAESGFELGPDKARIIKEKLSS